VSGLDISLDSRQLEQEVGELQGLAGVDFSHAEVAEAVWNDRYGALSDPALLGFRDDARGDRALSQQLWRSLKAELHSLACTDSAQYADLRSKISALKGKPATVIVSTISVAIAGPLGMAAGVLVPFVAIFLHGVLTVGVNTMCRAWSEAPSPGHNPGSSP
jgi:hypothetical protein